MLIERRKSEAWLGEIINLFLAPALPKYNVRGAHGNLPYCHPIYTDGIQVAIINAACSERTTKHNMIVFHSGF